MVKTPFRRPRSLTSLFTNQGHSHHDNHHLASAANLISALAADLLSLPDPTPDPTPILESHSFPSLLRSSHKPFAASIKLFALLKPRPLLALEVFKWRRDIAIGPNAIPLASEEYAKAITIAGCARNPDLAGKLFSEAIVSFPKTALYNALMSAYMYNGMMRRCLAVFQSLRQDRRCKPTIVSYNILLTLFGRTVLVDHMEAVLQAANEAGVKRTLTTQNTIIASYITGFMWDRMEATYHAMQHGPVKPELHTHLLLLRGYAHAGNIEKMENTYKIVSKQVKRVDAVFIRAMICAYCKIKHPKRLQRIEELLEYIADAEYRPWLHVLLIRVYAQEGLVEVMKRLIDEAFSRKTTVTTSGTMRSIITCYFHCGDVDQLAGFLRSAERAGWKLCRSVFHCKMLMYGMHNRLKEMHDVLDEMKRFRLDPTKKTLSIIYKVYFNMGRRLEVNTVVGMMFKFGVVSPTDGRVFPLHREQV
ncbi:Pentatricopeptide repeat-containing protein [Rhynchospora pubera]|uniref:Pentatricopeptide repeat-containing protein n=1 Tax=Rhynchospora pubera TaxID=906938 RepID=A0AAV8GMN4_9POAL|nr:Pentatricopeptide repeat-containing protein [Rhynchospora pubera]